MRTTHDFNLRPYSLLRLLRPLYILPKAGYYWHAPFAKNMTAELGMQRASGDLALLFRHVRGELIGVKGTCVDDTLLAGLHEFMELNARTGECFYSRAVRYAHLTFSGIETTRRPDTVLLQQRKHA